METKTKEREVIVERLAEIRADPKAEHVDEGEKLDRETTKLLRKLADDTPAKPAG